MILCERATHSTNLYYSALKFLSFKQFVWSGSFLPLKLQPLAELFSVQVTLRDQQGTKLPGAYWERGLLHADFESGRSYDLDMRLEYCLPVQATVFEADFGSIHPKHYTCALDFSTAQHPDPQSGVRLKLGDEVFEFKTDSPLEQQLPGGHRVALHQRAEYRSFIIEHETEVPYGHRHFPDLSLCTTA